MLLSVDEHDAGSPLQWFEVRSQPERKRSREAKGPGTLVDCRSGGEGGPGLGWSIIAGKHGRHLIGSI